ncbi:MAG: Serine--tRNA ligase [Candidatus Diapherotrites archaeon ADurb.Bin253]|jgi:seryl-tRNA synthetase|nr:MAG: Serine--tRNA ligase [Candidatus Diapherotrites archaeon ADurb.Bin253]HNZ52479.1 serine--tRNA ligase [Candidatus Pacearchaeota archaeon]HOH04486.1 serine--tRNA ligase [Candidatus Pacearchaeota archaeon]HPX74595.1 serine--tRNA ligase [Candidatus Pacearchaeota archaeon]HQC61009.1 serine--tRNA ligase [Candidatus Pacearchaeota archaeon]
MIDIKILRENPDIVKENIRKKFQDDKLKLVDEVLVLDEKWRKAKYEEDGLRSERNKVSEEINQAKKKKDEKAAKQLLKRAKEIPDKIAEIQEKRKKLEEDIKQIMYKIPNIIHDSVPIGKDSSENVEIKRVGKPEIPNYEIFNHAELAEKLNGVDFDSARETSGNGFYFLTGDLAVLHSAMIAYARDYMIKQGFSYVIPPFMIRKRVVEGVMSFTEMENMMYKVEGEDLYLIGTSEHSMIGRFIGKTLNSTSLPITLTSYSPCFRKEIGAHGIEEKGFYRLHQFEKQEMIVICEPEESYRWYEKMLQYTVDVFKNLDVPVRTLECCSGDLADLKAKSADVEAWSPRQKKYYEVGSCSNLTEAQARRLDIKIENKGKRYFAHTLNNTVLASPRALIAVMENNQQKDGSIKIPKVLQPYMGGKKIIGIKKEKK